MRGKSCLVRAVQHKNVEIVRAFSSRQEIVEGVFLFHRHGDRTPGKSLVAEEYVAAETSFWQARIPPTDQSYYEMLSQKFTPRLNPNNNGGQFKDASGGNQTFGFLSWKGMAQMHFNGREMASRYGPKEGHFQDYWDITAFSTNYLRTVKSCQAFLDGLLISSSSSTAATSLNNDRNTYYQNIDIEKYISDESASVEITVRDIKDETLNAFDSSQELMKNLCRDVIATPEFIAKDTKAANLAARLSNYIPGLMNVSSYSGPTISGINWMDAADHFICRASHCLPLTKFSHLENETSAEDMLQALSYATISQLSSRFQSYYQSLPILHEMAGPALDQIKGEMNKIIDSGDRIKKPFNIYSCHDVTILALLYAIRAYGVNTQVEIQVKGVDGIGFNDEDPRWPSYATCLTFELLRVKEKGKTDEFMVKIWLNEAPIPKFKIAPIHRNENEDGMELSEFNKLVTQLNKARVK